jgi:hypothetical protein
LSCSFTFNDVTVGVFLGMNTLNLAA